MEKQLYYVNLNPTSMQDIHSMRINDGQLVEYEIEATQEQRNALEKMLREMKSDAIGVGNIFSNTNLDDYQHGLNNIYQELYRLGTTETKQQIEEINLLNN